MSERAGFLETLLDGARVEWVPLGKIGVFTRGNGMQKKDFVEGGFPAIHYGQIYTKYGLEADSTFVCVTEVHAERLKKAQKNDLLLATTSENDEDVVKPLAWFGKSVAISGDMMLFRHEQNVKYLVYYIQTDSFQKQKRKYITGAKVRRVSSDDLSRIEIPIPCPEEPEKSLAIQGEIVRILDAFTELTAELTAELEARKKQFNHYRDQLLTFEEGDVEWKTLGEIGQWYGGGTPSKNQSEFWENGTIPWISPKDMGPSIIEKSQDYISEAAVRGSSTKLVPPNSIAIVVRSSILDKFLPSALVPIPATLNQDMKSVVPNEGITPRYIAHVVTSRGNDILKAARKSGGSVASIDSKKLFNFQIPVPEPNEQARIVSILDKFDALTHSITEGLPREIALREKQYAYYRDQLLSFPKPDDKAL